MNYQKIYNFDLSNGEGIRVSLFVSGCSLHCEGCFNKEAWDFNSGTEFGRKEYFAILDILKRPECDGLSILGGEPFDQKDLDTLIELCKMAHAEGKNVWIWSGYTIEEINFDVDKRRLLQYCDILVEGRYKESLKDLSLPWRGSKNQAIIDVNKTLDTGEIVYYE